MKHHRQIVTLRIDFDLTRTQPPESWGWASIAGETEDTAHISLLAAGPVERLHSDPLAAPLLALCRAQARHLGAAGVPRITSALDANGHQHPMEASYVLVIHPADELEARALTMPNGSSAFIAASQYPIPSYFENEIGALRFDGVRVVLDFTHAGMPRLYGAGQRDFKVGLV